MSWLRTDRPAAPVNTATLRALMGQLETVFSATAEARRNIDQQLGTDASPPRTAALRNLKEATNQQIASLRAQISAAFQTTKAQATANRQQAARDFAASADGATYLQCLTAFAALAPSLNANGLAERINTALNDGLHAHAKAWSTIARLNPPSNPAGVLYLALDRAAADALTPAELASTLDGEYLDNAERRYNLFTNAQTDRRLEFAVDRGDGDLGGGQLRRAQHLCGSPDRSGHWRGGRPVMADTTNPPADQQDNTPQQSIPYARFKSVNDKYRAALTELATLRQAQQGSTPAVIDDNPPAATPTPSPTPVPNPEPSTDYRAQYEAAQAELAGMKLSRLRDRACVAHGIPLDLRVRHETTLSSVHLRLAAHRGEWRSRWQGYSLTDP